jgi:multimeric flavodoxin WrbA
MNKKVIAIVGSYRKEGIVDSVISEILATAETQGAETKKIYLIDKRVEFCTNCRTCAQTAGPQRGKCIHDDDMEEILKEIEHADAIILGSPVNCFNITAISRRFFERLVVYSYWPWGKSHTPGMRDKRKGKKAVLVTSSAMPAIAGKFFTGAPRALKIMAEMLGAKPVQTLFVGMVAQNQKEPLSEKVKEKARKAGARLVS